jgi:hypothetical protein
MLPSSEKLNFDATQRVELMLKLHETTKENIERMNAKYRAHLLCLRFRNYSL